MKKLILTAGLMLATFAGFAQTSVGARLGATLAGSSFSSAQNFSPGSVTGFHGGLLFDLPLVSIVSLQPELLVDQRGSKITSDNGSSEIKVNYVTVPLLLKANIPIVDNLKINVQAGGYAGIAFGGTYKTTIQGNQSSSTQDGNVQIAGSYDKNENKPQVSFLDYGLMFGGGVSYDLVANVSIFADARWAIGVAELQKYDKDAPSQQTAFQDWQKAANRSTMLSLGVLFKISN